MDLDNEKELVKFLSEEVKDPANPLLKPGTLVGNWVVKAYLGGGGFGEVYRVEHQKLNIICALKILKDLDPSNRARFFREVEILAREIHSGVPRFYELNQLDSRPYVIMELLYPRELPNKDRDVAKYLHCLCGVVGALHQNGFVHRDIKPFNVLFRKNGELVLVDYGLVKAMALGSNESKFSTDITQPSLAVGTNRYAAPEQLMGEPANVVADIHSIGVLIDTCFNGSSPKSWRRIIQKATSSIPKQRFASVDMLDQAIRLRFLYLIFIALGAGFLVMCFLFFYVLKDDRIVVGHPAQEVLPMQKESIKDVQKIRNAGDSASEWF